MSGPPDKFSNYLSLPTNNPSANLTALSNAWAAYFTTYGVYPSVWVAIADVLYYGGY